MANLGVDYVGLLGGAEYHAENGSGALTVFDGSRATVSRSTFTGNWNGVDDNGAGSTYVDTIFWKNTLKGGISPGKRYELDIIDAAGVRGSFIHGDVNDLRDTVDRKLNTFDPPDPRFDAQFVPQSPVVREGWLPASHRQEPITSSQEPVASNRYNPPMETNRRTFMTALAAGVAATRIVRGARPTISDRVLDARLPGVELEEHPRPGRSTRLFGNRAPRRDG